MRHNVYNRRKSSAKIMRFGLSDNTIKVIQDIIVNYPQIDEVIIYCYSRA